MRYETRSKRTREQYNFNRRNQKGTVTVELALILTVMLFLVFYPMIDLLYILAGYGMTYQLNEMQTREASLVTASQAASSSGRVRHGLPESWKASGLGRLLKGGSISTQVGYSQAGDETLVSVTTRVTASPLVMLSLPSLPILGAVAIPGLSAPFTVVIQSERPVEDPHNLDK